VLKQRPHRKPYSSRSRPMLFPLLRARRLRARILKFTTLRRTR
jgi:hypothetical protein